MLKEKKINEIPLISVITPSYNSEKLIHRVYESLENQTYKNFEWIIINDGSTDNTRSLVHNFMNRKLWFPIIYLEQANGGKGSACNVGIVKAKGDFSIIADADDRFKPNAFEKFIKYWFEIAIFNKQVGNIWCNCITQNGDLHGGRFKDSPIVGNLLDYIGEEGIDGEKWIFFLTEALREFPFNTTVDIHVPPSHVWHAMAEKYSTIFINEDLRIYYVNQKEHVSIKSNPKITYPKGRRYRDLEVINKYYKRVKFNKRFVKTAFRNYVRMSIHSQIGHKKTLNDVNSFKKKIKVLSYYPSGWYAAFRDRRKGRI